jgi:hypothetical protein
MLSHPCCDQGGVGGDGLMGAALGTLGILGPLLLLLAGGTAGFTGECPSEALQAST